MTEPGPPSAPSPPATFADALHARRLVFDGPMGTPLLARGHGLPLEALNDSAPNAVREMHAAYVAAGARVLRANTLLAREGEVRDAERLARLGVALARESAPPGVWVGAPIGAPLPKPQASSRPGRGRPAAPPRPRLHVGDEQPTEEPGGNGFPRGFREAVADQARAVSAADFISLETFLLPLELETALEAVRESWIGPVVAFCTLRSDLPTRLDAMSTQRVYGALLAFVDVASRFSPAAVGVNCVPPGALLDLAVDFLARESPYPWGILPAAAPGGPRARPGRGGLPGRVPDAEIAETCVRALDRGAAFAGACCGATPETVRRITALASAPPGVRARHRHGPPSGRRPSPQRAGFGDERGFGDRPAAEGPGQRRGSFGRHGGSRRGRQGFPRGQGDGGQRAGRGRPYGATRDGEAAGRTHGRGWAPGGGPRRGQGRPGRPTGAPYDEGRGADGYGDGHRSGGRRPPGRGGPGHRPAGGRFRQGGQRGAPPFRAPEGDGGAGGGGWVRRGPRSPGADRTGGAAGGQGPRWSGGGAADGEGGRPGGDKRGRRPGRGRGRHGEPGGGGGGSWSGRSGRQGAGGGSWSGRSRPPFGRGQGPRDEGGSGGERPGGGPGRGRGGRPGAHRGRGSGRGRPPREAPPGEGRPDDRNGEETGGAFGAP
jgi:methionine synthase I (cobalamin-dependent)